MKIKLKPLKDQVIVITGASSGIGLCTAFAAAEKGARLVLAARNEQALYDIAQEINDKGGEAIAIGADVARQQDVQRIADMAMSHFGGFDTWVNNAGVSVYGRLLEVSDEDNRRLFDTNFWGVVYGSQMAAMHLRNRGGAIINIGSVLSDMGIPMQGMYSATKHAVKGFTDSLRIELEEDEAPVSVTLIKPSGINTPYPDHAKNYTDHKLTLPPPVYEPEEVANAILYAATHQKRDLMVGGGGKLMSLTNKIAPGLMDTSSELLMTDMQLLDEPAQHREGALHRPGEGGRIHGRIKDTMPTSLYTRALTNPVVAGAVVAAAGAAALALMGKKRTDNGKRNYKQENTKPEMVEVVEIVEEVNVNPLPPQRPL
ncbi:MULTISPECIES: SDR family oxidoreductase [Pontibacter]|uniref:Short-chain dehydrogenase n=1 Tax=Pontibacter lucknowensis TaxID=1077936 RepID=A0A1N6W3U0_9BACT|nr:MULTISPECIES: SDR family oxidoreductase [Pontibacter]EJF08778.1 short-chain dehydrogenase/reductase SDR [Pontibacter sp. BAB1700]SIQ84807.1 Short-chain dehydrogenase [Pontibacter lucknowensis]